MENQLMVYVAADPKQPGAAWAGCSNDPRFAKECAEDISEWVKDGATIMLVTPEVARDMMIKWKNPKDKQERLF